MPYVNIQIIRGATRSQKTHLVREVTDSLVRILGKKPEHTHVVIQEIAEKDWGFSGLLTDDWKKSRPARQEGKPSRENDTTAHFSARGGGHPTARGSPYAATWYREVLAEHGLTASMSRRGNCWDHAVVKSVPDAETEHMHHQGDGTREEARQDMFEWIDVFYNRVRRHSTLGSRSPAECEAMATGSSTGVHGMEGRSVSLFDHSTRYSPIVLAV